MANINSYTGEVSSGPVSLEEVAGDPAIPVDEAVLEAVGIDPDEPVVIKGRVGSASLTVEPAGR